MRVARLGIRIGYIDPRACVLVVKISSKTNFAEWRYKRSGRLYNKYNATIL